MKRRKDGSWYADSPYHLIGWEIVSAVRDGSGYILDVLKKDTRESRTVKATAEAVPMSMLETYKGQK